MAYITISNEELELIISSLRESNQNVNNELYNAKSLYQRHTSEILQLRALKLSNLIDRIDFKPFNKIEIV